MRAIENMPKMIWQVPLSIPFVPDMFSLGEPSYEQYL